MVPISSLNMMYWDLEVLFHACFPVFDTLLVMSAMRTATACRACSSFFVVDFFFFFMQVSESQNAARSGRGRYGRFIVGGEVLALA